MVAHYSQNTIVGVPGYLPLRGQYAFSINFDKSKFIMKSLSLLIEPELSEPKARTQEKQFSCSPRHFEKLSKESF